MEIIPSGHWRSARPISYPAPEQSNECRALLSACEGIRTAVTDKIVIYTKAHCGACQRAKALLRGKGVKDWTEYDLDRYPHLRGEMIERAGGRTTVPQVFIEGRHIGRRLGSL